VRASGALTAPRVARNPDLVLGGSRATTALGARRGITAIAGVESQTLRGGCAATVVVDERLGRRFLVDDHEPICTANHLFEFFVLVPRDKGEAIVLGSYLLVLGNGHLDPLLASNLFVASRSTLAKKLETFRLVSWPRFFGNPVEPFDPFVYFTDQRFVSRLSFEAGIHGR
jgi:hypothetical protein